MEWATSCPPPRHNFTSLPRIRSESPTFDLHHPEVAALDLGHGHGRKAAVGAKPAASATEPETDVEGGAFRAPRLGRPDGM